MTTKSPAGELCAPTLVDLFNERDVNCLSKFASCCSLITREELDARFAAQVAAAPRRARKKKYLVGHNGVTASGSVTTRREEHLAIAIWNAYQSAGFVLPEGQRIFPIDYQLPLKLANDPANAGVGKVDLFCLDEEGQAWVAELKVRSSSPDTPLKAVLQAVAYCAILDAEKERLVKEIRDHMPQHVTPSMKAARPNVLVLAPAEYWDFFANKPSAGNWAFEISRLCQDVKSALGISVRFVSTGDCGARMMGDCIKPDLSPNYIFRWAPVGPAVAAVVVPVIKSV